MPKGIPPKEASAQPRYVLLPSGSFLWRVTRGTSAEPQPGDPAESLFSRRLTAPPPDDMEGGRFDSTADRPHSCCYAALDDLTALCEVLLKNVGFDSPLRYVLSKEVTGRRLVLLETVEPLWLVSLLRAEDLAAARQDTWLIHAEKPDYAMTRQWGRWLRDSAGPDGSGVPAGIMWPSKRQPTGRAIVLYGDRCEHAVVRSAFARKLDDDAGLAWLNRRLSLLNTRVASRPVRPPAPETSNS